MDIEADTHIAADTPADIVAAMPAAIAADTLAESIPATLVEHAADTPAVLPAATQVAQHAADTQAAVHAEASPVAAHAEASLAAVAATAVAVADIGNSRRLPRSVLELPPKGPSASADGPFHLLMFFRPPIIAGSPQIAPTSTT
jgi:hypothetical protein